MISLLLNPGDSSSAGGICTGGGHGKKQKRIAGPNAEFKGLIAVLAAVLICYAVFGSAGDEPIIAGSDTGLAAVPAETLAAEFRELRKIKGHFDGGTWNDDVDRWLGRKHRLMMELGSRLSKGKYHKHDIPRLLDPPDQSAGKGDELYRRVSELPGNDSLSYTPDEYLVYYWRGRHDFLYFACLDGRVAGSGWWYALEYPFARGIDEGPSYRSSYRYTYRSSYCYTVRQPGYRRAGT